MSKIRTDFLNFLFPDRIIDRQEWLELWSVKKRELFFWYMKRSFLALGIAFFIHPLIIEIPIHVQNLPYFLCLRWGLGFALISMVAAAHFSFVKFRNYVPIFTFLVLIPCFLQGLSLTWDPRVPVIFSVVVSLLFSCFLFMNAFNRIVIYTLGTVVQAPFIYERLVGNEVPTVTSLWIIGLIFISLFGFVYFSEVEKFIEKQRYVDQVQITQSIQSELLQITSQVAHDIRSPLAALKVISHDLFELSEERRSVLRIAIDRINDIANTLAYRNLESKVNDEVEDKKAKQAVILAGLIDKVLSEKRVQYRLRLGIEIHAVVEQEAYGLFVDVKEIELGRVLSNLIDNSVEAIDEKGTVEVRLSKVDGMASIVIQDSGKGIEDHVIEKIGNRGFSFGKQGGSGLGLYHAKTQFIKWNGNLEVKSQLGVGTSVLLSIPITPPPSWFLSSLSLNGVSRVLVLDDDVNIHQIWERRFHNFQGKVRFLHLSDPQSFLEWISINDCSTGIVYLVDFEFKGSVKTGLDLLKQFGLQSYAVLVTSRYEEPEIRSQCEELGVRLLPKSLAGFSPVE